MKKALAILFIVCFAYQLTVRLGVVAWYEANKEYVAKVLCENRDKPQMNCCGKCYLKKQLNTGEQSNQPAKASTSKWEQSDWLAYEVIPVLFSIPSEEQTSFFEYYIAPLGYDPLHSVFHPPPVCNSPLA